MRLAIIGSRSFNDYDLLVDHLHTWIVDDRDECAITEVISGGAKGADSLAARWAKEHGIKLTEFIPDWDGLGKKAGFIRNEDIVKAADVVLAFWDGVSKGTQNSLSIAKRLKKTTIIVYV